MSASTIYLIANLKKTLGYADMLLADIPADKVTHMPHPTLNHPLWCFGHLSIYPDLWFATLGHEGLASPKDGWGDQFGVGSECVDDAARYPSFDDVVNEFRSKHEAIAEALLDISDETFAQENPHENMRDFFPTTGEAINFMFANHLMMHLGQVSAWRRCIGLGSAM